MSDLIKFANLACSIKSNYAEDTSVMNETVLYNACTVHYHSIITWTSLSYNCKTKCQNVGSLTHSLSCWRPATIRSSDSEPSTLQEAQQQCIEWIWILHKKTSGHQEHAHTATYPLQQHPWKLASVPQGRRHPCLSTLQALAC